LKPKQLKILDKDKLFIKWDDDLEDIIPLNYLRDECPCASCKGETVLLKTYIPAKPGNLPPEGYLVKSIQLVGGYAIQIVWGDGHSTGIYTWDYLKQLSGDQDTGKGHDYEKMV
jgi:DUF971 family protein